MQILGEQINHFEQRCVVQVQAARYSRGGLRLCGLSLRRGGGGWRRLLRTRGHAGQREHTRDYDTTGDGNFHVLCMLAPGQEAEAEAFAARLVERAQAMDGTCTGEHGVGYGKKKYLNAEHGEALEVMRDLKRALDPENRMNPGKIVDL